MSGLGRKELVYLNQHLSEVKPVEGVPEACELDTMPGRKQNDEEWTAILPAAEIEELKRTGPVISRHNGKENSPSVYDLTWAFGSTCERVGLKTYGTSIHVLRSIFRTVGAGEPLKIAPNVLEANLGHIVDKLGYDRPSIEARAKALIPLWEYFRQGGPPTATRGELEELKTKVEAFEQALGEETSKQLIEIFKSGRWPEIQKETTVTVGPTQRFVQVEGKRYTLVEEK